MNFVDFKKFTEEHGAMPIYLFEGEEVYFREKGAESVVSAYVSERTLDYTSFDGALLKGDKLKALVSAVESVPFLSNRRVVRVNGFYPTEKDFETYLKPLFSDPPSHTSLVIVNEGKGKAGTAKLSACKTVTVVSCNKADTETIVKWIYVTAKRAGIKTDGTTCELLAGYCVNDMARIEKETEKLLCYCTATGQNVLTDEIVNEIVYPDAEYKIYELSNAVARKNATAFEKISDELFVKGFDELNLISSLAYYFKELYETTVCRGSDREIGDALGIKEFRVKKDREAVSLIMRARVFEMYAFLSSVSAKMKSGELTPSSAWGCVKAQIYGSAMKK